MKARNKVTGEVVSNFGWSKEYGTISYIGADGVLHNYFGRAEDWEVLDESEVDWAAYRREAAKAAMQGILSGGADWQSTLTECREDGRCEYPSEIANFAVACADALIKQLQEK